MTEIHYQCAHELSAFRWVRAYSYLRQASPDSILLRTLSLARALSYLGPVGE